MVRKILIPWGEAHPRYGQRYIKRIELDLQEKVQWYFGKGLRATLRGEKNVSEHWANEYVKELLQLYQIGYSKLLYVELKNYVAPLLESKEQNQVEYGLIILSKFDFIPTPENWQVKIVEEIKSKLEKIIEKGNNISEFAKNLLDKI